MILLILFALCDKEADFMVVEELKYQTNVMRVYGKEVKTKKDAIEWLCDLRDKSILAIERITYRNLLDSLFTNAKVEMDFEADAKRDTLLSALKKYRIDDICVIGRFNKTPLLMHIYPDISVMFHREQADEMENMEKQFELA